MKAEEIRGMSVEDMRARVAELEEERFRLKFRSATETLEDPLRLRSIRRDIARLYTIVREQELRGAAPATPAVKTAAKKTTAKTAAKKSASKTAAKAPSKTASKKTSSKTAS
jgi:large subunit ribosomal protein L29